MYVYPDSVKLKAEYLKKFGDEFLRINNLKEGDQVELEFSYQKLSYPKRTGPGNTVTFKSKALGVLKRTEAGALYAESLEDFPFYQFTRTIHKGKEVEGYKSFYKKSTVLLGQTFITATI